jgi:transposase
MYMAYSNNPNLPRVRMEAVRMVRSGLSTVKVARYLGYSQSAVVKWVARAPRDGRMVIPTLSSRPLHHPRTIAPEIEQAVIDYRHRYRRDAFFIHHMLTRDGLRISLSSVKRILKRNQMSRFSKWKKWHQYPPRPVAEKPGNLVEIDTIHDGVVGSQLYMYTLIHC